MDTPSGLTYRPFFPVIQSIYAQANQMRMLQMKQQQELKKNALDRATKAVGDAYKNQPERTYHAPTAPYFSTMTKHITDLAVGVKRGTVDPFELQQAQYELSNESDELNRKSVALKDFRAMLEKEGIFKMDYVTQKESEVTYDLNATADLGTPTVLRPSQWNIEAYKTSIPTDLQAYDAKAVATKWVDTLMSEMGQTYADKRPGKDASFSIKTLPPEYLLKDPSPSGNPRINVDADPAGLLNRFRAMSPKFDQFLQLRAAAENPDFASMKPESDEWGLAMQRSLKNFANEYGYVKQEQKEAYVRPREPKSDTDKAGTAFDSSRVGGNRKVENQYLDETQQLVRLFSPDPQERAAAQDIFIGKGVKDIHEVPSGYIAEDGEKLAPQARGYLRVELDMNDPAANPLMAYAAEGGKVDKKRGVVYLPLDPDRIRALASYANLVRPSDVNPTLLKKAFDKFYRVDENRDVYMLPLDEDGQPIEEDAKDVKIKVPGINTRKPATQAKGNAKEKIEY